MPHPVAKVVLGVVLMKLDVALMSQIKSIIRQWARNVSELEFEAIWAKCLASISKACQNLRYARLSKTRFQKY